MLHRPRPRSDAGTSPRGIDVTHVVASLSKDAGGPSYSVPALARALAQCGAAARVRTVEAGDPPGYARDDIARCSHPSSGGLLGRLLRASPSLKAALAADARGDSILHTHGLWLMPNIYPARLKRLSDRSVSVIHSPRGMLAPVALGISAWKKRPFWWLLQKSALEGADCIHATAPSEYEEIRAAGLRNPIAIIPNGIDLPLLAETPRRQTEGNVVLSFGRIHPKKGLDRLLRAWARIEGEFPTWRLRIVGPAEIRHDEELRALAQAVGAERVSIEGPIYDTDEKLAMYRDADLFVLPTLNENFALTVAEALGAEVPVVSTKGAPWAGLEKERCGWWIDHGEEPLASALRNSMSIGQAERRAMGQRGRAWMARDFGWGRIGSDMLEVYRWLKDGGEPPSTVRLS